MASIFGHSIVGYTISRVAFRSHLKMLTLLAVVSSILPDIDVLTFHFGVSYEAPLGHRGFTHSIFFALVWAIIIMFLFGKGQKWLYFFVIFFSTISHGILDAMTTGGRGVGFFVPFDDERYFFPIRMIKVSPLRIMDFFSDWGMQVILSEVKFILVPCGIVLVILHFLKK